MKNIINYYYNIIAENIHQTNDIYIINSLNDEYVLKPYYGNINNLYQIYQFLINNRIYCHEIIYNKQNQIITIISNKPYILLRIHYRNHNKVNINNILTYNILIENNKKCNWYELWCNKLDYYEYQVREYGKKYSIVRESFSYYNGLCETAICLLNNIKTNHVDQYLNHQRITKNMNLIDFYDPLNIIEDVKIRDISEYYKNKFFEDRTTISQIQNYLYSSNLNYTELILLYIRLIYPSYYFDTYDEIIQGRTKEEKLLTYINKTTEYEIFLKQVYITINKIYKLPEIEWIIKK